MITSWQVYWITRLDGFIGLLIFFSIVSFIIVAVSCIVAMIKYSESQDRDWCNSHRENSNRLFLLWKKVTLISLPIFIISTLLINLIPSTKELAAIYLIPKIVNNEQVQKIPDNALKLLNGKLEQWIKDMGEKKK